MFGDSAKAAEWLLQAATSAVFLIPGYVVVRFLQTTRESRTADNFELTIQSLIYSLFIAGVWLYVTPPGRRLSELLVSDNLHLATLFKRRAVFISLLWLAVVTTGTGTILAVIHHKQLYWRFLDKIGLGRLNGYITTWEELSDLSKGRWVSVETSNGQKFIGVVAALTPHPHERSMILARRPQHPIQLHRQGASEACDVDYIWFAGDEVKSVGVFPHTPTPPAPTQEA